MFILAIGLIGCGPRGEGDAAGGDAEFGQGALGLTGEYVGQTPPGNTPELFAPGLITTGTYTRDVAMTPDGSELYFGVLPVPDPGRYPLLNPWKRGWSGEYDLPLPVGRRSVPGSGAPGPGSELHSQPIQRIHFSR